MSTKRLAGLYLGLVLFGVSVSVMVRANLGLDPWDVLHQGLSRRTGIGLGWVVIGVGALALLLWLPLRQRPGLGTVKRRRGHRHLRAEHRAARPGVPAPLAHRRPQGGFSWLTCCSG